MKFSEKYEENKCKTQPQAAEQFQHQEINEIEIFAKAKHESRIDFYCVLY